MSVLFLFQSTHQVIKAEKTVKTMNCKYNVVPVPKSISPECGMALEVETSNVDQVETLLNENNIVFTIRK